MQTRKQSIGAWGESAAADWLSARGYEILGRNLRVSHGEIDLLAKLGDVTVFVEVKTLTRSANLLPEDNVTPRKLQRMMDAAQRYAEEHEIDCWQLDVIAVEGNPSDPQPRITHFENVG